MYNESYKNEYIKRKNEDSTVPTGYLERQFSKTSYFEERINKDVSEWTSKEIIEYYKFIGCSVLKTLVVLNSHLSQYTQWMLEKNLVKDHQNHFLEINDEIIINQCLNISVTKSKILLADDIYNGIQKLDNYCDKFMILALFEGIKGKDYSEIVNARTENFYSGYYICEKNNRKMKVSKKLESIALSSAKEDEYTCFGSFNRTVPLFGDYDLIIKQYSNVQENSSDFQKGRRIYIRIQKIINYIGWNKSVTANSIYISGQIHFIKEQSKIKNMSTYDYIYSKNFVHDMVKKYGDSAKRFRKKDFWELYKEYLK